jgi:hypothetical protein
MSNHRANASLLAMPEKWDDRKDRWKELTVESQLLKELCGVVQSGATSQNFDALDTDLKKWREFVKNLPDGEHQWNLADQFLDLARQATLQPDGQEERMERAAFSGLETWKWDAFCTLCGADRQVEGEVKLSALLIYEATSFGVAVQLILERIKNGHGEVYPAPVPHAFTVIKPCFKQAIDNAVGYVKVKTGLLMDEFDVRFRLERYDKKPLPSPLSGPSLGAGFAIGLLKLLAGETP